jgi:hypothetical protein
MGLNLKMFDTLGMITVVTPPSMMNPEKLSFTIINLKEKEKNHFAKELNTLFPNDNITIYMYDNIGNEEWLETAITKSKYVLMDKDKAPIWINEIAPNKKTYSISKEQTVEQTFETISKQMEKQ